jgi:hypothetical protein
LKKIRFAGIRFFNPAINRVYHWPSSDEVKRLFPWIQEVVYTKGEGQSINNTEELIVKYGHDLAGYIIGAHSDYDKLVEQLDQAEKYILEHCCI